MIDTRIRTAAAALVLAAGLVVSGCASAPTPSPTATATADAATPTPEPQTQAQQCAQLMTDVQGIAADVPRVGELLGTDPFGALALVGDISNRVGDLHLRVTDPELVQRIEQIQAGWDAIVQDAQESLGSGDVTAIERVSASLTELGQQVSDLQQLCTGTP
ncbi:hypothetical protein [Agrococcus jenensis]|uniref:Uncharacterized protein n=1 Tax=Agrococcus jenensis TaxID=46353 RepID=A0A3N2AV01_9MICO|nr:hypothetical protein [Agrococcus jenensis]ROR66738.1 hypothetical protein EDD26_2132 [Agrococcus jenensis]